MTRLTRVSGTQLKRSLSVRRFLKRFEFLFVAGGTRFGASIGIGFRSFLFWLCAFLFLTGYARPKEKSKQANQHQREIQSCVPHFASQSFANSYAFDSFLPVKLKDRYSQERG
jgi:hypothetical protein